MPPPKRLSPVRAAAALVLLVAAGTLAWRVLSQQANARVRHAVITLPPGVSFATNPAQFSLSPDGRQLAATLRAGDVVRVWTWALAGVDARPLTGTEGASSVPAWSPDGQNVAFVSGGHLRRMAVAGGPVQTICDLPDGSAVDWGEDGTMLLASGGTAPISRVAAAGGGQVQPISRLYPDEQHEFPRFIPGLRRFVFFVRSDELREGVWVGSFNGGLAHRVVPGAVNATVAGGYLVYPLQQLVIAQAFDAATDKLTGDAVPLADHVRINEATGRAAYAISSSNPVLLFQSDIDGALHMTTGWTSLVRR
jgi:hypothetical protein